MCGACGEQGTGDWARPWISDPAARRAVAAAVTRTVPRPGTRVSVTPGGWLVAGPTGTTRACDGLTALVAAVRGRTREPVTPIDPGRPSGRLSLPTEDHRQGIVLRVDPVRAAERDPEAALTAATGEGTSGPASRTGAVGAASGTGAIGAASGTGAIDVAKGTGAVGAVSGTGVVGAVSEERTAGSTAGDGAAGPAEAVVRCPSDARAALAVLASPRWLPRCYLAGIEGVDAPWGRPLTTGAGACRVPAGADGMLGEDDRDAGRPAPERSTNGVFAEHLACRRDEISDAAFAADVVVRLEWERQSGRLDGDATLIRLPLGPGAELEIEIRDGHVVRARTLTASTMRYGPDR
ncbi:hypothetical protein [Actinoallomurus sp. CA-150999]|uniref:hypothetical protein n=1 Tax=Actinoallomurus sp. CA-150999 TaxID=3239887 RepID=UPI003D8CE725